MGPPLLVFLWWGIVCRPFWDWGTRFSLEPATAAAIGEKPPVIYLRSFQAEESGEERVVAAMLEHIGPVLAIGRPGEVAPRLGAARLYASDSEWQAEVSDLIRRSCLVVMLAGSSTGLGWEIGQCKRLLEEDRLLILVPTDRREYQGFVELFSSTFGVKLPDGVYPSRWKKFANDLLVFSGLKVLALSDLAGIIGFEAGWRPIFFGLSPASYSSKGLESMLAREMRSALLLNGNSRLAGLVKSSNIYWAGTFLSSLVRVFSMVSLVIKLLFVLIPLGLLVSYYLGYHHFLDIDF
jgi:hypothetical protein